MVRFRVQSSVLGKLATLLAAFLACACVGFIGDRDGGGGSDQTVETEIVAPESEPLACVAGEWPVCLDDANLQLCVSGYYEVHSCASICELHGYGGGACAAGSCECGAAANEKCAAGAQAVCACIGCDYGEFETAYASCELSQNPFVACFAEWVSDGRIDCAAAAEACL